jgi:O-antigen/teichoic acid export membrane protein
MKFGASFRRVGFTFGAQIYNQIVNIGVQILLVPVLLHAWGPERYGVWLLLSAIPTYLTFTDFGFTLTAKNEMTMKVAKGDQFGALVTYQSVFVLLNFVVSAVIIVALAILFNISLERHLGLASVPDTVAKLVIFLLGLNVILYQYVMLFSAGLRAVGLPATESALAATGRLVAGAATAVTALLGGDLAAAAIASVLANLGFGVIFFIWVRCVAPWLKLGWQHATRHEIKRLFHPSISFMSQTLGQAFAISGPVIALGMLSMPLAVVTFSTSRTLARLGTTATNVVSAAIMPEYSRLFGAGNYALFRRIAFLQTILALAIAGLFSAFLLIFGGAILDIWTHGEVHLEQPFFALLLLAVAAEMLWTTIWIPICAINRHVFMAHTFGILALVGVIASYFFAKTYGLVGVITPLLIVNIFMVGMAIAQRIRQLPAHPESQSLKI